MDPNNDTNFQGSSQAIAQEQPVPSNPPPSPEELRKQRQMVFGLGTAVIVLVVLVVGSVFFLLQPATPTEKIRDIFIIFMAVQSLLIGLTLVILIVQLARLINLLQNEIKPILDSTNETVSTLRGTIAFLSDNVTEPVVKLNETLAAIKQVREFFKFTKKT